MSRDTNGSVRVPYRVVFGDTDALGVVYYANYLRFFEMGRNEFLRAHGGTTLDLQEAGLGLLVIETGARYITPARYDDVLQIEARLEQVERVRLRFGHRIYRGEELLVEGFTLHACVRLATGRAVRMPPALHEMLTTMRG